MARGMANNEPIVSQAQTAEFDEGYDRIFGRDRKPQRGKFVFDARQGKLVSVEEYVPEEELARDAPIMVDRFYEGTHYKDGDGVEHDLGSRRRHREFMRERGWTTTDDYKDTWAKKEKDRAAFLKEGRDPDPASRRQRRDDIGRAIYELEKKNAKRR